MKTRNVVERCFGVWKRRFPILLSGIRVSLQTSQTIVIAAVVLHNLAVEENNGLPGQVNQQEEDNLIIY